MKTVFLLLAAAVTFTTFFHSPSFVHLSIVRTTRACGKLMLIEHFFISLAVDSPTCFWLKGRPYLQLCKNPQHKAWLLNPDATEWVCWREERRWVFSAASRFITTSSIGATKRWKCANYFYNVDSSRSNFSNDNLRSLRTIRVIYRLSICSCSLTHCFFMIRLSGTFLGALTKNCSCIHENNVQFFTFLSQLVDECTNKSTHFEFFFWVTYELLHKNIKWIA